MLWPDEKNIVGLAIPDGAQEARDEFDEAASLLELFVLLEESDDVFEARVERIGGGDFIGDGFRATIGDLGLGRFLQFLAVGVRDVVDFRLVR